MPDTQQLIDDAPLTPEELRLIDAMQATIDRAIAERGDKGTIAVLQAIRTRRAVGV